MNRIFLDANVLFTAAHNPRGKAAFVIELGSRSAFKLMTSMYAYKEAERNITAKYPVCLADFKQLSENIIVVPIISPTTEYPDILPAKDAPIFAGAVYCHATHLLTGDTKHFGPIMNQPQLCNGIIVQTVSEFLNSLLQEYPENDG